MLYTIKELVEIKRAQLKELKEKNNGNYSSNGN